MTVARAVLTAGGAAMTNDLTDWPRKYYQEPGGNPFLFYGVFGTFSQMPALSSQEYRSNGVYPGLQLSHYDKGKADYLGKEGLQKHGKERWLRAVNDAFRFLKEGFIADYVVIGGGQVKEIEKLPEEAKRGGNHDAFTGGFRLWQTEVVHADQAPAPEVWGIVV
jgi:hypothetical protein